MNQSPVCAKIASHLQFDVCSRISEYDTKDEGIQLKKIFLNVPAW
jgi:hypothetical protein